MSDLARQLPPLSTLVVFEAAVRLGSFSRAADECTLSQASVSRQMRQLEENLNVRLFERQRYDVSATTEGKVLYDCARRSLSDLASIAKELRATANGHKHFTIYSDLSIAIGIISPLLGGFQQQFPGVKFHILSSYEPIEQTQATFDIGFQVGRRAEALFDVDSIADDLIYPVCSPAFAKKFAANVTAAELALLPLLHIEYDNKDWVDWRRFLANYRIRDNEPPEQLVFSSYQVCLDVAERGDGVALGWARSVKQRIGEGKLVRFTCMSLHVPDGVSVYMRKQIDPNPIAMKVIEEVRAAIKPIVDWV